MTSNIRAAVTKAVEIVNSNAGHTCVSLRFADDLSEIDFVANGACMRGGAFEFQAGFETYCGSVDELSEIRTEVIQH